jgi:hypothetical protein
MEQREGPSKTKIEPSTHLENGGFYYPKFGIWQ